jgi:peptidyl-Lys metalloendopeptidase
MFQTQTLEESAMNKSKVRFNSLVLVLLIALLVTSIASAAPKDGPTVKLSVAQGEFDSGEEVLVTVNISNSTKHTVKILKWYTAVEGVEESLFAVTRDGEPVAYTGPIYKRPAATGQDYISLKSGESITSVVNLGGYYDLSASGQYEVFYAVASFNMFNEKGNAFKFKDVLTSEKISFKGNGSNGKGKPTPPPPPPPGGNTFNSCDAGQQSLLVAARDQAKIYAANSENYLLAGNQGSRYTTWFGQFSSGRYDTVKNNFIAISNAMDNAGVQFDCKCKQPYYAYVYPNDPYKIYLCKVFWQAPLSGTDSKAGTLIHEMSHFDVVAGTDDVVYGKTGAMNLASTDPNAAITNADSHEYFAENTPALP